MVILWMLLLICLIIFIQYILFHKAVFKGITYSRKILQKTVFEGETCHMEEKIENKKMLWVPWLYVESLLDIHLTFGKQENLFVSTGTLYQNHASFFMLKGNTRVKRTHKLTPIKRGVYRLTSVTLTSGDLLGFSKQSKQYQLTDTEPLLVYPKPLIPIVQIDNRDYSLGDIIVRRFIMPDPFMRVGTREFAAGDDIRSINWNATARTTQLQVNQYDYTSNKRIMVLINCQEHEEMWKTITNPQLIEQYIRYAAGITQHALDEGIEVGFASNMPSIKPDSEAIIWPQGGLSHWYTILDDMAHLKIELEQPFHELLQQFTESNLEPITFVVLAPYWDEQCELLATQLRYRQHQVLYTPIHEPIPDNDIEINRLEADKPLPSKATSLAEVRHA